MEKIIKDNLHTDKRIFPMKIIVNTCNTHLHLVPIFCHLFNKYWGPEQPVTIIGYNHPNTFSESFTLPKN